MCGSLFGGGRQPQMLVSAPPATNVTQNTDDKTNAALQEEKRRAQQYGASKTRTQPAFPVLNSAGNATGLRKALGG